MKVKIMRKALVPMLAAAICAASHSANAYTGSRVQWTGQGDGTTLNAGGNWNNGGAVPGTTNSAEFYTNGTLNVTANADFSAGCGSMGPNGGPLTVNLDLGSWKWTGNAPADKWNYRFVAGGTKDYPLTFNFTDGVISNMSSLAIGCDSGNTYYGGSYNTTFNIRGGDTVFHAYLGGVTVGKDGTNNVFTVSDGAFFRSGREIIVGIGSAASNNLMCVTGAGSRLEMNHVGNHSYIGNEGSFNELLIKDGATVTKPTAGHAYLGAGATAHNNRVTILNGASASFCDATGKGDFCVGKNGGYDNVLTVSNAAFGAGTLDLGATGRCNRVSIVGPSASALFYWAMRVGGASGANSNVVFIADGAIVSNAVYNSGSQVARIGYGADAVGNRVVVSNATFYSGPKEAMVVNGSGRGNRLEVLYGAKVFINHTFRCGDDASSCDGLILVAGEGSVLTNNQDMMIDGWNNGVSVEDGGTVFVKQHMKLGTAGASHTNNFLRIANGEFYNITGQRLYLYNGAKLIWEGSKSKIGIKHLHMQDGAEMEMIADEDGLAEFGPEYSTYMLNNDWTPSVKKITVDARRYLKNNSKGTFTILKSDRSQSCATIGDGTALSTQSADTIAAANKAFEELIEFIPADCGKVESVDMTKSKIIVSVKKHTGFILTFR